MFCDLCGNPFDHHVMVQEPPLYEADPLVCPRCYGPLKIRSLIGDAPVIEKILRHLKLWDRPERPPPRPAGRSIQNDDPIVDLDEPGDWPDATA